MSDIPPDITTSAAQAGFQAREVAKERDAHRSNPVSAAKRDVKQVDEAGEVVETTDNDTKVFADSEGGGSLGRPFEEHHAEDENTDEPQGITRDDDGQLHVDLEA